MKTLKQHPFYHALALLSLLIFSNFLISCQTKKELISDVSESDILEKKEMADSMSIESKTIESKSPAGKLPQDRKFVRTADLKFRTKDVRKTTYLIEDLVGKYNGFITYNDLRSEVNNKEITEISEDSLLEISTLSTTSDLNISVPNKNLDSLLRAMNRLIEHLDFRTVKAEDISLQMLSNQLKIKRLDNNDKRLQNSIDKRKGNVLNAAEVENQVLEHQNQSDDISVENMRLQGKVDLSTVNLSIYQREIFRKEMVSNPKSIEIFKPSIFIRTWQSFKTGWIVVEEIIVFLTKLWAFALLGLIGFFVYQKYWKIAK